MYYVAYSVWVGDQEINDYLIESIETAVNLARDWIRDGYDDVAVEEIIVDDGEQKHLAWIYLELD